MNGPAEARAADWARALLVARLFAADPAALGGVRVRAAAGPARDAWIAALRRELPAGMPRRRAPIGIADDRLIGGIDLAATLAAGRPVGGRGILAEAHGGVLELAMAERLSPGTAARIAEVLDRGEVAVRREGLSQDFPARFGVLAFDEGIRGEEAMPAALADRLAFEIDLDGLRAAQMPDAAPADRAPGDAGSVEVADRHLEALCAAAQALGVGSARATLFASCTCRLLAWLDGRRMTSDADVEIAAALVLAPRALRLPPGEPSPPAEAPPPADGEDAEGPAPADDARQRPLDDVVIAAAVAAIPAGLLERLRRDAGARTRGAEGRAGEVQRSGRRGRPAGTVGGMRDRRAARLDIAATLRAAAPWQRLRRANGEPTRAIDVRPEDFRMRRFETRRESVVLFAVDASGSAALHRLAEAKGAVELLLADCYVRRDRVAVLAFRGARAELVLPPTRSLVRARRALGGLPGGGGTPLAGAIDKARALCETLRRGGATPGIVLLTDGRANVARDGTGGRARAEADALDAARRLRAAGVRALLVDTGPRPSEPTRTLAQAMGAVYLALPHADARGLDRAVRATLVKA